MLPGVVAAAFFALRNVAGRSSVTREQLPGPIRDGDEHIALLRLDGAMFFGAAAFTGAYFVNTFIGG